MRTILIIAAVFAAIAGVALAVQEWSPDINIITLEIKPGLRW